MTFNLNAWQKEFKRLGYRFTNARKTILNVLCKKKGHLSIGDIYQITHKIDPEIGLTTIYRTLDILVKMNIVNKFEFGDGRARFEFVSNNEDEHHHHLVCNNCGKIIDYSDFMDEEVSFFKKVETELSRKYNFEIHGHLVRFYGLCAECS